MRARIAAATDAAGEPSPGPARIRPVLALPGMRGGGPTAARSGAARSGVTAVQPGTDAPKAPGSGSGAPRRAGQLCGSRRALPPRLAVTGEHEPGTGRGERVERAEGEVAVRRRRARD